MIIVEILIIEELVIFLLKDLVEMVVLIDVELY